MRVLIADDDPSIVKIVGDFVGDMEFETIEACGPREALALASQYRCEVALLDVDMPEMDGFELMSALHKINRRMKVIFITGDFSPDSVSKAISNGAFDYIWKPIDFRQLRDSLNTLRELATPATK